MARRVCDPARLPDGFASADLPVAALAWHSPGSPWLVHAIDAGAIRRENATQLGDVLARTAMSRQSPDEITSFDSTGLAVQDLAIALAAMERAAGLELETIEL